MLMGASAPFCYFALAASRDGLVHWVRMQHMCTSAMLAFISACAGAFKLRCVRRACAWRAVLGCVDAHARRLLFAENCCRPCCT